MAGNQDPRGPHWMNVMLELRAFGEVGRSIASRSFLNSAPRGDGHPVLVLPGLMASDASTIMLRHCLSKLGYVVEGWGLGRNWGAGDGAEERLRERLIEMGKTHRRTPSLVGQSMGGVFARYLAACHPNEVRSVATLGSPIAWSPRANNAWRMHEWMTGKSVGDDDPMWRKCVAPAVVPSTSIYSKSDGIVHWKSCVATGPMDKSIEVGGTHTGMAFAPKAILEVAKALAEASARRE